ncbi:MAG TPA: hypothetical protein VKH81_19390 [Candidatus Angelobacter sp.]|nr:hypothetical protein [Candidatus Angelobacter sp.]
MEKLRRITQGKKVNEPKYKPGYPVPRSGIYCVEHRPHRLMHMATLIANMRFPRCKQCGEAVRFTLFRPVKDGRGVPFRNTAILEAYPDQHESFPKAS